ncbi:MAG: biopolymer transporter ExbD [Deltaproteobacteria bacterium]|nr:MAG: biopolymer transporter ExbD [Deltaproteobacteria bacterium]
MAMDLGGAEGKHTRPEMNVTPLVDVVLVLLIIFMVLAPVLTRSFFVRVPPKEEDPQEETAAVDPNVPVVLGVHDDGSFDVNGRTVDERELSGYLRRVFNARPDNVLYLDGADDVAFAKVIEAIDLARRGGAAPIVLLTKKLR